MIGVLVVCWIGLSLEVYAFEKDARGFTGSEVEGDLVSHIIFYTESW